MGCRLGAGCGLTRGCLLRHDSASRFPAFRLVLLSAAALLIHGYHLGVDDAEIYLPAARRLRDPQLYPFAPEFFLSHGHLSLFSPLLAATSWVTHLSIDAVTLGWYCVTLWLMLAATWLLASACFEGASARWTATGLLTTLLAMPAANTGLLLMDPYLTARSFSTPLTLVSIGLYLRRKYWAALATMVVTGLFHPQMVIYLLFLFAVLFVADRVMHREEKRVPVLAGVGMLPSGFHFAPATEPYREALYSRDYFFLYNWEWYHWLGVLAPLGLFWWAWKRGFRGTTEAARRLSFALIPFGVISILAGGLFATSTSFDMFERLQPMRSFHLITIVMMLFLGGLMGEYLVRGRVWLGTVLLVPVAVGMFFVGHETYPNSPQIELPGMTGGNPWLETVGWIRENVPADAVFAVDAAYLRDEVTDTHGFRALSGHSALADAYKDSGVVSLFPDLAPEWKRMSTAATGVNHFTVEDFRRLEVEYPAVNWTVIHGSAPAGLSCPYARGGFVVCRLR